jgi:hypothetical protein
MDRPKNRLLATLIFKRLRRVILGSRFPGDSQGTLIIKNSVATNLIPQCRHDDYLISLELITYHLAQGGTYVEVPVILHEELSPSNIRVVQDGIKMFWGMLLLAIKVRWRIPKSAGGWYQPF